MITTISTARKQQYILEHLTEEDRNEMVVLTDPQQFSDYHQANRVYQKNMAQLMNYVNHRYPEKSEAERSILARVLYKRNIKRACAF